MSPTAESQWPAMSKSHSTLLGTTSIMVIMQLVCLFGTVTWSALCPSQSCSKPALHSKVLEKKHSESTRPWFPCDLFLNNASVYQDSQQALKLYYELQAAARIYNGYTETFRATAELAGLTVITHNWRRISVTVMAKSITILNHRRLQNTKFVPVLL